MNLSLSRLGQTVTAAAFCWVLTCPVLSPAADPVNTSRRIAPMGVPVQQVNYNNYAGNGTCPNGTCYGGTTTSGGWNNNGWASRGWGGGCLHGHLWGGCQHCRNGFVQGNAFVRPPAVWPVASSSNTYQNYWSPSLTGTAPVPSPVYPMIYHPTDTTQLGFSYKHVPHWGYRSQMLPAAPIPNWELGQHTVYGDVGVSGYAGTTLTPVPGNSPVNTSPVTPAAPQLQPVAPVNVPPPPADARQNANDSDTAVFPDQTRQ
jgi:hypothetical protein